MNQYKVFRLAVGFLLFLVGILTATGAISEGLSYDAASIVGAILSCTGILILVSGVKK